MPRAKESGVMGKIVSQDVRNIHGLKLVRLIHVVDVEPFSARRFGSKNSAFVSRRLENGANDPAALKDGPVSCPTRCPTQSVSHFGDMGDDSGSLLGVRLIAAELLVRSLTGSRTRPLQNRAFTYLNV